MVLYSNIFPIFTQFLWITVFYGYRENSWTNSNFVLEYIFFKNR